MAIDSTKDPRETPMMKQYLDIKSQYPDMVIFFRMGDFYEMFFDDAQIAADVLQITLTQRQKGVPMAGIPFHALDGYLQKMVESGYKVVICEQKQNKPEKGEKIVQREVARIVTPGTLVQDGIKENHLISVYLHSKGMFLIICDFATGELLLRMLGPWPTQSHQSQVENTLRQVISCYGPSEFLLGGSSSEEELQSYIQLLKYDKCLVNIMPEWIFDNSYVHRIICEQYQLAGPESLFHSLNADQSQMAAKTLSALLYYLNQTQKGQLSHLQMPRFQSDKKHLLLDESAIQALDIVYNQAEASSGRTLFAAMDHCLTLLGKRRLRQTLLSPSTDIEVIESRQQAVSYFVRSERRRQTLREKLYQVKDIEKLLNKVASQRCVPADMGSLRDSLQASLSALNDLAQSEYNANTPLGFLLSECPMATIQQLLDYLNQRLEQNLGYSFDSDIILSSHNAEIEHFRQLSRNGRQWLNQYQQEQRQKTGIAKLRIKYNKVFGYFIEISRLQANAVPADYQRKQTLVNAERFTTETLQKFESDLLSAEEKLFAMQKKEYLIIVSYVLSQITAIQHIAQVISWLDVFATFAHKAVTNNYVCPIMTGNNLYRIIAGRHPVVEQFLADHEFVSNDLILDSHDNAIAIITGPNMAGKSTFIRQVALIVLLAQTGSFVPAQEAVVGITDRIFTRIGASDNLSRGHSTFFLEMSESANILQNYSSRSLIVLDELGRGTSTFDGMSIAWSIIESISQNKSGRPRTLFATHYHELTALAKRKGVFNLTLQVEESKQDVVFLRKVIPGAADRSYGIHVAKLAGVPRDIIRRAYEILKTLENEKKSGNQLNIFPQNSQHEDDAQKEVPEIPYEQDLLNNSVLNQAKSLIIQTTNQAEHQTKDQTKDQMENQTIVSSNNEKQLLWTQHLLDQLQTLQIDHLTPMQAMEILWQWQQETKNQCYQK